MPEPVTRFETGRTYVVRSVTDHTCQWRFTVSARTAHTVTIVQDGGPSPRTRRVRVVAGVEQTNPFGRYSFAPILRADRPEVGR